MDEGFGKPSAVIAKLLVLGEDRFAALVAGRGLHPGKGRPAGAADQVSVSKNGSAYRTSSRI